MYDELEQLCSHAGLLSLLRHYAVAGELDRDAWHDRVMEFPDVTSAGLVRLHGELIAHQWIELDTGAAAARYRVTAAGRKALRHIERRMTEPAEQGCA